ncbi:hypothetical protein M7I_1523 [Glarea lozoyensis 74030]|uniref:Uncharacterized protein n=1 Tax=Glarea lozoyensis (strain ATCC 74030 / MF5533) TaxID=1104152 RepID=H0EGB1_GLAL7|nr:hypothetical protein M7I_1523 [Glarea lozoyensis 74030]
MKGVRWVVTLMRWLFWVGLVVGVLGWGRWLFGLGREGGREVRVGIVDSQLPRIQLTPTGAGPAGIGVLHALSQQFPTSKINLNITLFDSSPTIGGRLTSLSNSPINITASEIATGCLSHNTHFFPPSSVQTIKTTTSFTNGLSMPRPRSALPFFAWVKLLFRYGLSVEYAKNLPTGTMDRFRGLLSDISEPYRTPFGILQDMTDATSLPASTRLGRNHIQGAYVSEILAPKVRRQTGCSISELSDLSLSMAVEREDSGLCTDALSYQVVAEKKVKGKADVRLDTKITAVRRSGTDAWSLEVLGGEVEEFDIDYRIKKMRKWCINPHF